MLSLRRATAVVAPGAATKALRQGSVDVLKAVATRNADAAKTAFGAMTKSCGACHKAHKGKKKAPAKKRL